MCVSLSRTHRDIIMQSDGKREASLWFWHFLSEQEVKHFSVQIVRT